jgi:4-methyl-5(b-hydroxyethyl)-thiazole monophosphate biosynthesis
MHDRGRLCAAICAAPSVFARVGILAERAATCYPGVERQLNGAIHSDSPVVVDGNIITSRSAGTAIAFSLEIVKYLLSDAAARTVAAAIVYAQ